MIPLLHKLLDCTSSKPLYLGEAVVRHTSPRDSHITTSKLLLGAHKCAFIDPISSILHTSCWALNSEGPFAIPCDINRDFSEQSCREMSFLFQL
jgi:hypothetical protein